jgi:hypothetical protein
VDFNLPGQKGEGKARLWKCDTVEVSPAIMKRMEGKGRPEKQHQLDLVGSSTGAWLSAVTACQAYVI